MEVSHENTAQPQRLPMLVSQVFVISKLGGKIWPYTSISLAHLELFENKPNTAQWILVSEPSSRVRMNIILKREKLWAWRSSASNLHYGFGEEATDWFLVKEKVLASGWCKPVCQCGQMILAQWKGYGFHTPVPLLNPSQLWGLGGGITQR